MGCNVNAERDAIASLLSQSFPQRNIWPQGPATSWHFFLYISNIKLVLLGISRPNGKSLEELRDLVAVFGLLSDWPSKEPYQPTDEEIAGCNKAVLVRQASAEEMQNSQGREVAIILTPITGPRSPTGKCFALSDKKAFFSRTH